MNTQTASTPQKSKSQQGFAAKHKIDFKNLKKGEKGSLLREFFLSEIKDIYWAEKHLTKALPKMAKAATTAVLRTAFEEHLVATNEHISRLEQVFDMLGEKAQAKKCDAMEGIVKEGEGVIEDTEDDTFTRDVGLIVAAQKVEHYEITTYGSLVQLAITLGEQDIADLLATTLQEEKETDAHLTQIAENDINWEAKAEGNGQTR